MGSPSRDWLRSVPAGSSVYFQGRRNAVASFRRGRTRLGCVAPRPPLARAGARYGLTRAESPDRRHLTLRPKTLPKVSLFHHLFTIVGGARPKGAKIALG